MIHSMLSNKKVVGPLAIIAVLITGFKILTLDMSNYDSPLLKLNYLTDEYFSITMFLIISTVLFIKWESICTREELREIQKSINLLEEKSKKEGP